MNYLAAVEGFKNGLWLEFASISWCVGTEKRMREDKVQMCVEIARYQLGLTLDTVTVLQESAFPSFSVTICSSICSHVRWKITLPVLIWYTFSFLKYSPLMSGLIWFSLQYYTPYYNSSSQNHCSYPSKSSTPVYYLNTRSYYPGVRDQIANL